MNDQFPLEGGRKRTAAFVTAAMAAEHARDNSARHHEREARCVSGSSLVAIIGGGMVA